MKHLTCVLVVMLSFSVGCGSWKNIPIPEIENHPEQVTNKKVRVEVPTPARPLPRSGRSQRERLGITTDTDSTIVLHVTSVSYPMMHGVTIPDATLTDSGVRPDTVAIDLTHALRTDVRVVGVMSTLGLMYAAYIVAILVFAPNWGWD
jgi:hypothetical protein